jgi:hypothetical protein
MTTTEDILQSKEVQEVLKAVALSLKWGEVKLIIKDGKVVMSRIEKDIKHS